MLSATSRYFSLPTTTYETPAGETIVYLRRRFVPRPEALAPLEEHTVALGERLDTIAAARLGDPEQFWRICDANRALRPEELTETVGRRLRITLPAGVPGAPDA
jgi:hypothetical protein